jgi:hypothetical protein
VVIDMEGDFNELGPVFYSEGSSANILSLAQLVDSGGDVRYEAKHDHFTLRPQTSNSLYTFARKDILGSEGRFYVSTINHCSLTVPVHTVHTCTCACWFQTRFQVPCLVVVS